MGLHGKCDDRNITFMIAMIIKQARFKSIKCMNKRDKLHVVLIFCTMFLMYNLF
jgi:hypothetical protein